MTIQVQQFTTQKLYFGMHVYILWRALYAYILHNKRNIKIKMQAPLYVNGYTSDPSRLHQICHIIIYII